MPGRNLIAFRSGNWSEEFGILLLKTIAAVAPVPRQEDFGLDAVATLLRADKDRRFVYAESSFLVQFKSVSEKTIVYEDEGVCWLRNLQLPFFIGHVSRKRGLVELYPGHELNKWLFARDWKRLTVRICPQGKRKRNHDAVSTDVFLGKPLLTLDLGIVNDKKRLRKVYDLMKGYLDEEHRNVITRPVRYCRNIEWDSDTSVTVGQGACSVLRNPPKDDFHYACSTLAPGLQAAIMFAEATRNKKLRTALNSLLEEMHKIWDTPEVLFDGDVTITWENPLGML